MQEAEIGAEPTELAKSAGMRAKMYAFLAAMFNQKPDQMFVNRLHSFDIETLRKLAEANDMTREAAAGLSEIALFIESIGALPDGEVAEMLAIDWTRLFRGVAPDYGPKPPYEAVYLTNEGDDYTAILNSVMETYVKHGIVPEKNGFDRPDYIGVELDFLALLSEREEEAWRCGDSASGQEAYLAARQFINEHIGRWIKLFCDTAISDADTDFFRGLLRLTREMSLEGEA